MLPALFPLAIPDAEGGDGGFPALEAVPAALGRLAEQYKGKPNLATLLTLLCAPADVLWEVFRQLHDDRQLASATGNTLDVVGDLLQQSRAGASDDDYRARIRAKIRILRGSATTEDLYSVFALVLPAGCSMGITQQGVAAFDITIGTLPIPSGTASLFLSFLRQARAAGVYGMLIWFESDPAQRFLFDSGTQGMDLGHLEGAAV